MLNSYILSLRIATLTSRPSLALGHPRQLSAQKTKIKLKSKENNALLLPDCTRVFLTREKCHFSYLSQTLHIPSLI